MGILVQGWRAPQSCGGITISKPTACISPFYFFVYTEDIDCALPSQSQKEMSGVRITLGLTGGSGTWPGLLQLTANPLTRFSVTSALRGGLRLLLFRGDLLNATGEA